MSTLKRAFLCGAAFTALAASGCQTLFPPAPPTGAASVAPASPAPSPAGVSPAQASPSVSPSAAPTSSGAPMGESGGPTRRPVVHARGHGVIKSIDKDRKGVTIEHEANESLSVEAGVTHYRVRDKRVLTDMESGVEVDYDIDLAPDGTLVVSDLVEMGR